MHLVRSNHHQSPQARIHPKADPVFGNSYLHCGVNYYSSYCIRLGQAKTPSRSCPDWLLYCHHRIYHPPKPNACLSQRTVRRLISHSLRLIRCSARSLDFALEQRVWVLQDSLCHRYGNRLGQQWWVRCLVFLPIESGSILLDRLPNHVFVDVHGGWFHLPLCGWTLV